MEKTMENYMETTAYNIEKGLYDSCHDAVEICAWLRTHFRAGMAAL